MGDLWTAWQEERRLHAVLEGAQTLTFKAESDLKPWTGTRDDVQQKEKVRVSLCQ